VSTCESYQEKISQLLDGELSGDDLADVRAHISACPGCRRVYDAFAAVSGALSEELEEPPAALAPGILFKVRLESGKRPAARRFAFGKFTALAACAVLVLFAASKVGSLSPGGRSKAAAAPASAAAPESYITADAAVRDNGPAEAESAGGEVYAVLASLPPEPAAAAAVSSESAELLCFNAVLLDMSAAEIILPEEDAGTLHIVVTDEETLSYLAGLLTVEEAAEGPAPAEDPVCVIEIISGETSRTVTLWNVEGSLWSQNESSPTLYRSAGDARELLDLIKAA